MEQRMGDSSFEPGDGRASRRDRSSSTEGGHSSRFHHFFFFQAEDGIRDVAVTGVQTCALPIYRSLMSLSYRLGIFYRRVTSNPARSVTHRREDNNRVRFLTEEDEKNPRKVVRDRKSVV